MHTITKIIHYQAKPGAADRNAELSAGVLREAAIDAPENVRYAVLRAADGTFFHIVSYETEADNERLTGSPAFQRFVKDGAERRIAPPQIAEVTLVGNYHMFAD